MTTPFTPSGPTLPSPACHVFGGQPCTGNRPAAWRPARRSITRWSAALPPACGSRCPQAAPARTPRLLKENTARMQPSPEQEAETNGEQPTTDPVHALAQELDLRVAEVPGTADAFNYFFGDD